MFDVSQQISGAEPFMPHGMCYLWEPELLWMHVAADTLTGLAYWAIPPTLIYLVIQARRRAEEESGLPYEWIVWAFGLFIIACGGTHLMAVWTVWNPDYWISGGVKVVTALASVTTAVALPPLVPRILDVIRKARLSDSRRRQLEQQNRELGALNNRLQEAEAARTRFFANVSHELRTPLTLVLGPVDELLSEEGLPGDHRDRLRSVRRNARALLHQVDDLLEIARMEEGDLPIRPAEIDLAGRVRETAEGFRELARRSELRYEIVTPERLPAYLDPGQVNRLLLNLLSNAFKFAPPTGQVRCTLHAPMSDEVRLVVEDSGPGVREEHREAIFERFRRGPRPEQETASSTGLGLAIVQEAADAMGGSVSVEHSPLGGARFTVTLPRRLADERSPSPAATPPETLEADDDETARPSVVPEPALEGNKDGTILIVEDDQELAAFLARMLGTHYQVHQAHDGIEGLRAALQLQPDLILADLMMPEMDGEDLLREITRQEALAGTPTIILTARASRDLPARLLDAGAADYLVKPPDPAELRARVRNTLELHRTRRILSSEEDAAADRAPLQELAKELVRSRQDLFRSVQQKQVVVQELHHRVKGNLQTISSLLNIQRRSVDDESGRQALDEARGRISAMALVHERLYSEGDPSHLYLPDFLRGLAQQVVQANRLDNAGIRVTVSAQELRLPADRAITLGLLVYELLTNALFHAFPGRDEGVVAIRIQRDGNRPSVLRLTVRDNGVGFPPDREDGRGLGLDLVEALTRQLGGTHRIRPGGGTSIEILFPLDSQ